jgi:hypothetical protein
MAKFPNPPNPFDRLRAFGFFAFSALVYYFFLKAIAYGIAAFLPDFTWRMLVERAILMGIQVLFFAGLGFAFQSQNKPFVAMGLDPRKGWLGEAFMGLAVGWGLALAATIPLALFGGIIYNVNTSPSAWALFFLNLLLLAIAAMQEETVFRGYPFQRLEDATGPIAATLLMAFVFASAHTFNPGANWLSTTVTFLSGIVFATAYLRTRALWLPFGIHLGWNATLGLLFGLPVSGLNNFATVLTGNTVGPLWLTGGGYGVESSYLGLIAMLVALPIVFSITRDLDFKYNAPVIIPGGHPVNLEPIARQQHEQATGEPAPPTLVQILPAQAPSAARPAEIISPAISRQAPTPTSGPSHIEGTTSSPTEHLDDFIATHQHQNAPSFSWEASASSFDHPEKSSAPPQTPKPPFLSDKE